MIETFDKKTGKINAEENTKEWEHENAHKIYSEKYSFIQYIQEQSLVWCIASIILTFFINFFKYISIGLFLIYYSLEIYEEIWCNDMARERNL